MLKRFYIIFGLFLEQALKINYFTKFNACYLWKVQMYAESVNNANGIVPVKNYNIYIFVMTGDRNFKYSYLH